MTWKRIIVLLVVLCTRTTARQSCPQSRETLSIVESCPRNKEEWQRRSDSKQCSVQQCTGNSVYHCAINSFANETLEVCAPASLIIGHSCVEYNWLGAVIQESRYVKCNDSCPFSYNSTEGYRYQDCFQSVEPKKESRCAREINNSSERIWKIVAIVFIITTIIFASHSLWIVFFKKRLNKRKEGKGRYKYPEQGDGAEEEEECFAVGNTEVKKKDSKVKERKRKKIPGMRGLYVVGVDIGDSFLTMALSKEESPEDTLPLGTFERISLLLDQKDKSIAFGDEAFSQFTNNKSKNERYEDEFKLSDELIEPGILKEAITQILMQLYQALDRELTKDQQSRVHYVFVVPTYWSESAKERLKTEILNNKGDKLQNIDKQHVRVIPREQTLSPFIHEVNARVLCLKFNVDNLILNQEIRNYSYAILHIGSTYCDLAFLKVEKDRDANKIPYVKRHSWDKLPREHLLDFLNSVYGHTVVKTWEEDSRRDYFKMVYEFEELHKNRAKYTDEVTAFALKLPKSLTSKKKILKEKLIDPKTNTLKITHKFLDNCFKEMKDQVKEWIISERELFEDVSCVVMTGTYSNMEMVWDEAEEEWFKDMPVTIAVPENVHVFAMGGAYHVQKEMAMKATEPPQERTNFRQDRMNLTSS